MVNKILPMLVCFFTMVSIITPINAKETKQPGDRYQPISVDTVDDEQQSSGNHQIQQNGKNIADEKTIAKSEKAASAMQEILNFQYQTLVNNVWQVPSGNNTISGSKDDKSPIMGLQFQLNTAVKQYGEIKIALKTNGQYSDYQSSDKPIIAQQKISGIKMILTKQLGEKYDIYYRALMHDNGWQAWNKNGTSEGFDKNDYIQAIQIAIYDKTHNYLVKVSEPSSNNAMDQLLNITYSSHSQNVGWQTPVGLNQIAGVTGKSLALEAIKFNMPQAVKQYGDIVTSTYNHNLGWLNSKSGQIAGSVGEAKALEGLKITLTDQLAAHYDIYYSVHVADLGWLGWAKNGELAGSTAFAKPIEALKVSIVKKGETFNQGSLSPVIDQEQLKQKELAKIANTTYEAHSQMKGWQTKVKLNQIAGTTGQGLSLEAFKIHLPEDTKKYGDVAIDVHSSYLGWLKPVKSDEIAGSVGQAKPIEGFKIKLTGELANQYDIYYRAHVEGKGWLGWAKNGELAGSVGCQRRVEAIVINIVKKGTTFNRGGKSFSNKKYYPTKAQFYYRAHCQDYGWMGNVKSDQVAGTTGKSKRMEALIISKNDPTMASKGTINAQAHCQDYGWLKPVSAGHVAGVTGKSKRLEAIALTLSSSALRQDYDIYYRTHVSGIGWLGWAKNGTTAGSVGCSRSIEAIQIAIYPKRAKCPIKTSTSTTNKKAIKHYQPKYYSQHDSRWGSCQYGRYNLSSTGCVPTSIAMAIAGIKSPWVTPKMVADFLWSKTNQFNKLFVGSSGLAIKQAADHFRVNYHPIGSLADLNSQLSQGRIVIGLQSANSSFVDYAPGPEWTHAIVLYGYKSGGYCNVYDPNTSRRNKVYATGTLWTQRSHYKIDSNYKGVVFHALY